MKFKVGDKVRTAAECPLGTYSKPPVGFVGTITSIDLLDEERTYHVGKCTGDRTLNNWSGWYPASALELVEAAPCTILDEAKEVVDGPRRATYGHPRDNHTCTAAMWSAYLTRRLGVAVTLDARDVCWLNILQKSSRDSHVRHRDNLVDTAGWARNAELVEEPRGA